MVKEMISIRLFLVVTSKSHMMTFRSCLMNSRDRWRFLRLSWKKTASRNLKRRINPKPQQLLKISTRKPNWWESSTTWESSWTTTRSASKSSSISREAGVMLTTRTQPMRWRPEKRMTPLRTQRQESSYSNRMQLRMRVRIRSLIR